MIIECFYCESKVDAKIIATHVSPGQLIDEDYGLFEPDFQVNLLECPSCQNTLIEGHYLDGSEDMTKLSRIWPMPEKEIDRNIPRSVRVSLEEARKSFKAKAYLACAVMCGRALEAICSEYKTKDKSLAGGTKELLERGIEI